MSAVLKQHIKQHYKAAERRNWEADEQEKAAEVYLIEVKRLRAKALEELAAAKELEALL